jgi:hypothetical protein
MDFHFLPPKPDDAVGSKTMSSQDETTDGEDSDTVGATGVAGDVMVIFNLEAYL